MTSTETVNNEFEVGFNQAFEASWSRAEQAGRVVMIAFTLAAALGFLGRGPFSHATTQSPDGTLTVNYEPVARHGTSTMITVHLKQPHAEPHPIELRINQQIIEPMGFQHTVPPPDSTSITDNGIRLSYNEPANQQDALVRFEAAPNAIGLVPLEVSDGTQTIRWHILVVP